MQAWPKWTIGIGIVALIAVVPYVAYRSQYTTYKRLREVKPGVLYRSGQMTYDGFADAVPRYGIRAIVNLQGDFPDPDIQVSYGSWGRVKESEMCRRLGTRFIFLEPDLIPRRLVPEHRPAAIDRFLDIMDDPDNHPVLLHCKAGLHRTGVLVAVYRMEYENWTPQQAIVELKANGFGEFACSSANDYITQYILTYRPRERGGPSQATPALPTAP